MKSLLAPIGDEEKRGEGKALDRLIGPLFLFIAVGILLLAVWPVPKWSYLNYHPSPDAPEYLAGAVSIVEHNGFFIEIAGQRFPSRYPIGYSAAIAATIQLGVDPIRAPFLLNAFAAFGVLLIVYGTLCRYADPTTAGLATLLLVTIPEFTTLARAPMSGISATLWTTLGLVLLFAYTHEKRLILGLLGTILIGFSTVYRLANILLVPAVLASWYSLRLQSRAPARDLVLLGAIGFVGMIPLFASQSVIFGHPLQNGYSVWHPFRDQFSETFHILNIIDNIKYYGREFLQIENSGRTVDHYGIGTELEPASFFLISISWILSVLNRSIRWFVLGISVYPLLMMFYFFESARMLLPFFPPAAMLIAYQSGRIIRGPSVKLRWILIALIGMHCLGFPNPRTIATLPAHLTTPPKENAWRYELLDELKELPSGLVLSTFSSPYCKAILSGDWTISPAKNNHHYRRHRIFVYQDRERTAQIEEFLDTGKSVYLITDYNLDIYIRESKIPFGFTWHVVTKTEKSGGIAVLRAD